MPKAQVLGEAADAALPPGQKGRGDLPRSTIAPRESPVRQGRRRSDRRDVLTARPDERNAASAISEFGSATHPFHRRLDRRQNLMVGNACPVPPVALGVARVWVQMGLPSPAPDVIMDTLRYGVRERRHPHSLPDAACGPEVHTRWRPVLISATAEYVSRLRPDDRTASGDPAGHVRSSNSATAAMAARIALRDSLAHRSRTKRKAWSMEHIWSGATIPRRGATLSVEITRSWSQRA